MTCRLIWDTALAQTTETFKVLRESLEVISASNIAEHLHGAVRILASVMQVQRFEIAVQSLDNCRAHLTAALAIFQQLLDSCSKGGEAAGPAPRFRAVVERLGPPMWILPTGCAPFPSAEQAAFRFSSALLVFDDIIASTVLQEEPTLYEYHDSLLGKTDAGGEEPLIDLEPVVGCHNCVMRLIGEVAVLDAWKQRSRRAGNLDMMELVRRATVTKDALEEYLDLLASYPAVPGYDTNLVDVFRPDYWQRSEPPASQTTVVTRVWTHAALLYLSVVVSGWQPAGAEARHHVGRVLELLGEVAPPAMLRAAAWPFCVAVCLAMCGRQDRFRDMVGALRPTAVFGTLLKALEVMEGVWRDGGATWDAETRDLADCFRGHGDLVLLV